jgi:glycosyltransferase involved in cell wall biosynthesis
VYDAHELFTEIEEVVSRPRLQKLWLWIERHTVPHFKWGYTIGDCYAAEFKRRYGVDYAIVRNATVLRPLLPMPLENGYILYQGAVNRGRCFEELIPAMQQVTGKLLVCGEGNFMTEARALVTHYGLEQKIEFRGYVPPAELRAITRGAAVGITLFWAKSLSNEYSLANRFFDYLHAGVPQIAGAYPEYKAINDQYEVALLLPQITVQTIADGLNKLLTDTEYTKNMHLNALAAREVYNWQQEEIRLLETWKKVFAL